MLEGYFIKLAVNNKSSPAEYLGLAEMQPGFLHPETSSAFSTITQREADESPAFVM